MHFVNIVSYAYLLIPYETWWHFIHDIFMIWTKTEADLQDFISYLNSFHPTVKVASNCSHALLSPFSTPRCPSMTDSEPTDKHQCLLCSSHVTPYTPNELFHLACPNTTYICSSKETFSKRTYTR